jgi:hypothetical protein
VIPEQASSQDGKANKASERTNEAAPSFLSILTAFLRLHWPLNASVGHVALLDVAAINGDVNIAIRHAAVRDVVAKTPADVWLVYRATDNPRLRVRFTVIHGFGSFPISSFGSLFLVSNFHGQTDSHSPTPKDSMAEHILQQFGKATAFSMCAFFLSASGAPLTSPRSHAVRRSMCVCDP